jgi:hypothetical protein
MSTERLVAATPLAAAAGLPRVLVQRTRMAMPEPAYSYDLYVTEEETPTHARASCTHFTVLSNRSTRERFIDFANATCTPDHCAMPQGWERYQAWLDHEKQTRREALALARHAFPELDAFMGDALPSLWVPLPAFPGGSHAEVWLTFTP